MIMQASPRSARFLIQYHHPLEELNGVVTYVHTLAQVLESRGLETRLLSTKATSWNEWVAAIAWADIIHMNSNHLGFAALSRLLGKKVVIKYHYLLYQSAHWDYQPMPFGQRIQVECRHAWPKKEIPLKWKLFSAVKFARLGIRLGTAGLVNRHTACSHFLGESCSLPMPVTTVYNPIELEPELPLKALTDLATPPTFVFAGRVVRDKGPELLMEAAIRLAERGHEFEVVFVGDGPSRPVLEAQAAAANLSDRVQFLGWQSRDAVVSVMRKAIAVVVPSQWQDPAPYVVMEASSQQTCAIVAEVGGLPEMVGPDGLVFPATDSLALVEAMEACLLDLPAALARGRAAYEYARSQFSSQQTADTLLAVCEPLLGKSVQFAPLTSSSSKL